MILHQKLSAGVNIVWIVSVGEGLEVCQAEPKLEGHPVIMQIDTG